jgi:lysophospholipase L1-like esterase
MNNAGAIYVKSNDHQAVSAAMAAALGARGFRASAHQPGEVSGKIMIREKRRRLFFVLPAHDGWVAVFEDPRYFGERTLAQDLARTLATEAVWIEVSGNGVGWARAHYSTNTTIEELFEEVVTTFYGEYGPVHFAYDIETTPDEFIARLGLPHADHHYEAVAAGELSADAGTPLHLAFERP